MEERIGTIEGQGGKTDSEALSTFDDTDRVFLEEIAGLLAGLIF